MRVNNLQTVNSSILEKLVKITNVALNKAGELDTEGNILHRPTTVDQLNEHTSTMKAFVINKIRTKFNVEGRR